MTTFFAFIAASQLVPVAFPTDRGYLRSSEESEETLFAKKAKKWPCLCRRTEGRTSEASA
jgi:hypothetical protein